MRILLLLSAAVMAVVASADDLPLKTDSWGICWKCPDDWDSSISKTNTPGSAEFKNYRNRYPVYYAFMDGYDTRAWGTITNRFGLDEEWANRRPLFGVTSTNAYHRYLEAEKLFDRYDKLQDLYIATSNSYQYTPSFFWSSSKFDTHLQTLLPDAPPVGDFEWTKDPGSYIYKDTTGPLTCWIPCFAAMNTNCEVYAVRRGALRPRGIVWHEMLPYVSLCDPNMWEIIEGTGTSDDFSLPPFDYFLTNVFTTSDAARLPRLQTDAALSEPNITNALFRSLRHHLATLAFNSQALALFDRTVYIIDDFNVLTNKSSGGYRAQYKAEFKAGKIGITGQYDDLDISYLTPPEIVGGIISTNYLFTTNEPCEMHEARSRASRPLYSMGQSFPITNFQFGVTTDFGAPFYDAVQGLFAMSGYVEGDEMLIHLSAECQDDGYVVLQINNEFSFVDMDLGNASVRPGRYDVRGSLSFGASYDFGYTSYPTQGLPLPNIGDLWPKATRFKEEGQWLKVTTLMSFAEIEDARGWIYNINFGNGSGRDWDSRLDWGYRAEIGTMAYTNDYPSHLRTVINELQGKLDIDLIRDPFEYTGCTSDNLVTEATNVVLSATSIQKFTTEINDYDPYHADILVRSEDLGGWYELVFYDRDGGEDIPYYLNVIGVDYNLEFKFNPVNEKDLRTKGLSVDTHLKNVIEATWRFPQLNTIEE